MKKLNDKHVLILLGILIIGLGVLFFAKVIPLEQAGDSAIAVRDGWYYLQDGEKKVISLPMDIDVKDEASVTIYNDQIAAEYAGDYVYVTNAIYRPIIYVDDRMLYRYDDGGLRRNPPELSYQICKGKLLDQMMNKTLRITYQPSDNKTISLPEVYVGSVDTIVEDLFLSNAYITVITITMIMLGIFILLIEVITIKHRYAFKQKLLMLGLLLLTTGIWCVTDSPFFQYLLGYSNVNMYADFFVFMFLILPFIGYVKSINGMEHYSSLRYLILASLGNVVLQTIMALFTSLTYIDMVPVSHALIVAGVSASIYLLFKEYQKHKKQEVFLCLRAFAIIGIFAVISILVYFMKPALFYQNLFQTGILLFVLILLWNMVSEFIESLKYKAEAKTYKQLAEVDKLTNLANRRAFDSEISVIEQNVEQYENVLLMFIDVNGLKRINDSFGHLMGDEIIMAAADCIRRAFHQHGLCYRIGGDEFCVLIDNPLFSDVDAISFVEQEVESCHQALEEECHFSVAIGCSYLKQGAITKSIARWKEEADNQMYEDKKKKKFQGDCFLKD